jgi:hypothetical protein
MPCAVLGCGTRHTGHSGRYRNGIDNYDSDANNLTR